MKKVLSAIFAFLLVFGLVSCSCNCGKCGKEEETTPVTLSSISVTTQPNKVAYTEGESFDATGMVVTATYSDNTTKAVTDYKVDKTVLTLNDTVVTVEYQGKTATVSITVSPSQTARTYKADGVYTAFTANLNYGAPQYTIVTINVQNDEIVSVNIDQLQTNAVTNEDGSTKAGYYSWKAQTKKELGYNYRMHGQYSLSLEEYKEYLSENGKLEWFEQAKLIEDALLANGASGVTLDETHHFTNVSGVSISDNDYVTTFAKAVENAKNGVVISLTPTIYSGNVELDWAEATIDENRKAVSVKIDSLQPSVTEGVFSWKAQSKYELGYSYGLQRGSAGWGLSLAEYQEWLSENGKLEWFEQADLMAKAWVEGTDISSAMGEKVTNISGVSINNYYSDALAGLLELGVTR